MKSRHHISSTIIGAISFATAFFIFLSGFSPRAFAAAPAATSSAPDGGPSVVVANSCGPTKSDIAKIAAVQNDPSLSMSAEISKELALRKQFVGETISCAQGDLQNLRSAIAKVPAASSDAMRIKAQIGNQLDAAASFYSLELQKLNDAGIAGTQSIAKEVLSWRQGTYIPLLGQVNNFILWAQNQGLFTTAQARMAETQQAVSFLESASANADLQNAFNAAYNAFENAKNENIAAQTALSQSLPPDQSISLIKESLDDLSSTYKGFFDVSALITKLLPQ